MKLRLCCLVSIDCSCNVSLPFANMCMLVPYQDNGWDCGVYVCRYGLGLFAILLNKDVTYRDARDNFRELITKSAEFRFRPRDIVEMRQSMANLLENLQKLYWPWKERQP